MGLTAPALWALCRREYEALKKQWQGRRDAEASLIAALRADLHNTSAKQFNRTFQPAEFMPGATAGIEDRIAKLVEEHGYTPSEAAAIATSSQSREHNLYLIDGALSEAHQQKKKGARRKAG